MPEMIEDNRQLQAIVRVTALPDWLPRDRDMAVRLLEPTDQSLVFWLAVEHVMELAQALQRAGIRKIERAAQQQEPVTEDVHCILRELAVGESPEQLAAKYEVSVGTIYDIRWKNKHVLVEILAEWANEFSDLWAVKKHARVADLIADHDSLQERQDELLEDAATATEVMRRVDPDASPVRVPAREWRGLVRDKAKLKDQIAREMGQLPEHAGALGGNTHLLPFMGLRAGKDTIDHAKFLALRPDEQTVYLGMIPTLSGHVLETDRGSAGAVPGVPGRGRHLRGLWLFGGLHGT